MNQPDAGCLTPLEHEIVFLIGQGYSVREIAHSTTLAPQTVDRHISICRRKTGARNNAHLVAAVLGSSPHSA